MVLKWNVFEFTQIISASFTFTFALFLYNLIQHFLHCKYTNVFFLKLFCFDWSDKGRQSCKLAQHEENRSIKSILTTNDYITHDSFCVEKKPISCV